MAKKKDGERVIAKTAIFDLVEAPECEAGFRPVQVRSRDWTTVVAERNGEFLTVRQTRYGIEKDMTEFPCGMVEPGESALDAALRELEEETGISVASGESAAFLGSAYANPAFMTNKMTYWYVNLDECEWSRRDQRLDEHERLAVGWTPKGEFRKMADDGDMSSLMAAGLRMYDTRFAENEMMSFDSSIQLSWDGLSYELRDRTARMAVPKSRIVHMEEHEVEILGPWTETREYASTGKLGKLWMWLRLGYGRTHERKRETRKFVKITLADGVRNAAVFADGCLEELAKL